MVLLTKGPVLYVGDLFILWLGAFTCNPLVPLPTPIPHRDCVLERNVKENKKATARGHSLGLAGPAKATKVTEATSGDSDHQAPNGTAVMVAGKLCPGQGVLRSSATAGSSSPVGTRLWPGPLAQRCREIHIVPSLGTVIAAFGLDK